MPTAGGGSLPTPSSPLSSSSSSHPPSPALSTRSSTGHLRSPVARRHQAEPTLEELMRDDDALDLPPARRRDAQERRRSWGSGDHPPESTELHPPLYGRPGPSPSPDIFATLLHPLLSLSRPPSPAFSPPATPTPPLSVAADRSASSLPAHFPPRTPSDPAPTVESQGFVLYLSSLVAWVVFLVWGLCPDEWLEAAGIEWYPAREWALLVPAWTIMLAAFVYFSYIALNIFITPPLDSVHTLTASHAPLTPPHFLGFQTPRRTSYPCPHESSPKTASRPNLCTHCLSIRSSSRPTPYRPCTTCRSDL